MSERFESKKKVSGNFRKLLQERIGKSNPRRKLTAEEQRRLSKLEVIEAKLKRRENVQNRQLQTWLSDDEYEQVDVEWQEQLEIREEIKDKPSELKRYEDKLKEAIMMVIVLMLTIENVKRLQHINWTASAKAYVKMH